MRSFIFNSDSKLVAIALLTATILSLAHLFVIPRVFPEGGRPQSQAQENLVQMEDFLYSSSRAALLLLGSSKGARLELSGSAHAVNLAFAGGSALTGLALLEQKGELPGKLLVEVNDTLLRGSADELLAQAGSPWIQWQKRNWAAFRTRFQPVSLLLGRKPAPLALSAAAVDPENVGLEIAIRGELESSSHKPSEAALRAVYEQLKVRLQNLRDKGVTIVLFDTPEDPRLEASARTQSSRQIARQVLSEFSWMPQLNAETFHTSDGVHLLPGSAARYTEALLAFALQTPGKK